MNWYLLNIPLAIAILTALVAPIFVVISREHSTEQPTDLSTLPLRLADHGATLSRTGILERVS